MQHLRLRSYKAKSVSFAVSDSEEILLQGVSLMILMAARRHLRSLEPTHKPGTLLIIYPPISQTFLSLWIPTSRTWSQKPLRNSHLKINHSRVSTTQNHGAALRQFIIRRPGISTMTTAKNISKTAKRTASTTKTTHKNHQKHQKDHHKETQKSPKTHRKNHQNHQKTG